MDSGVSRRVETESAIRVRTPDKSKTEKTFKVPFAQAAADMGIHVPRGAKLDITIAQQDGLPVLWVQVVEEAGKY